jgi:HK97 family phage major capsid protein
MTAAERRRSDQLFRELGTLKVKLANAERAKVEEDESDRLSGITHPTDVRSPHKVATVRIGNEPHTYRKAEERSTDFRGEPEPGFITDLFKSQVLGDPQASERLARHGREMSVDNPKLVERAVNTGGVPGFLPPAYLEELFAEYARAGRPLANLCRKLPLPASGMSVNIPRVTTSTLTAIQATENATVGNQDPASTLLTANVNTIAGYVTVSRQAIERGPLTEDVIVSDLAADYNMQLDAQCVNGSGAGGQHKGILGITGINAITYTSAAPKVDEMWPKLADAVGKVMSGRFTGPTAIVMSPTQWAWTLAFKDSTGRPYVEPEAVAQNPVMVAGAGAMSYDGVAGYLFGIPIMLDGNVPANLGAGTNETRIIAADFRDILLFEDNGGAPAQLRFEAPAGNSLGIMLVAYGFSAFAAGRQPKAISVVSGTGLITPAL